MALVITDLIFTTKKTLKKSFKKQLNKDRSFLFIISNKLFKRRKNDNKNNRKD